MTESSFNSLLNAAAHLHYIYRASGVGVSPANLPSQARWLEYVAFMATKWDSADALFESRKGAENEKRLQLH